MLSARRSTWAAAAAILFAATSLLAGSRALVAEPGALSMRDECQLALGYEGRTAADLAWLQQCVSALTPPTATPTPSPTASPTPSPTPSPTAGPTPSPTPPPTTQPPMPAGWPGAGNTGVPAGVILSPYTGPTTVTVNGTVIDGKTFGCLTVRAANVVIRNSRQNCPSHVVGGLVMAGTNTLVEDTELIGTVNNAGCFTGSNYVLRRLNVHGCADGGWTLSNTVVQDSWIHDLGTCPSCHNDGIQTTGATNILIRHNRIDLNLPQTGCVKLGAEQAPLRDVTVQENLFNGGSYSLYAGGFGSNVSGIHILNNRWLRSPTGGYFPNGGSAGPVSYFEAKPGSEWVGNAWLDNGAAILP